ncbi:hypothetical protein QPK24_10950 [Paenibacillus polygoni]|uniref:Uncharacterized protein n=1 Tax=Paenibacillus polygoni TaxID=3050112 RepID=A0ABY8XC68_9BACL|nr:hypothetical protein [Paenibacillus polygoni]WIV21146.1 hypothetical protein QPK24_10950 [Paenibacillus polygoni]
MEYFDILIQNQETIQNKIEQQLKEFQVETVGTGYIDLITSLKFVRPLIDQFTNLGVIVYAVSWWCHCTDASRNELGCPHGLRGPESSYHEGWFSETDFYFGIENEEYENLKYNDSNDEITKVNNKVIQYIEEDFPSNSFYTECLTPSLCLLVPEEWKRINNFL